MEDKRYITTAEIMKRYGVTRKTIENWRKEGMPSIKVGRLVRFDVEETDKWFKTRQ